MLRKVTRDLVMFLLGFGIVIHETILREGERPYLLTAALALMGLPFVLRAEEKRKNGNGSDR